MTPFENAVARSVDGSEFAALYRATYWQSYRLAVAILRDGEIAAEATQEAYLRAFRALPQFRGDGAMEAWLRQIVVRTAISHRRLLGHRRHEPIGEAALAVQSADHAHGHDLDVAAALDRLSTRGRAAVILRYFYGHDYSTIASILGVRQGTVGTLLSRSLERIRRELQPNDTDGGPPVGND